jgi:RHS repeat-associated protein
MTVAWGVGGIWNYTYGAGNERVEAQGPADGSRRVYFYDVTGELLGEYSVLVDGPGKLYPKQERLRVSFAGRPLEWEDRLGSKVVGPIDQQTGQATRYRYYPYGQNIGTNVGWDDVQFATYTRDGATGLDYARNRYYTRTWGRFLSPDPYVASGGPADPGSWNRYAYVQGDPVNFNDPGGQYSCNVAYGFSGIYVNCTSTVKGPSISRSEYFSVHLTAIMPVDMGMQIMQQIASTLVQGLGRAVDMQADQEGAIDWVTDARWMAAEALASFSDDCISQIGISRAKLAFEINLSQYFDARQPQGNTLVESILGPGLRIRPGETFSSLLAPGDYARTLNRLDLSITRYVVLGQPFWRSGLAEQQVTLLHELMHYSSQLYDVEFAREYLGYRGSDTYAASRLITEWVRTCTK